MTDRFTPIEPYDVDLTDGMTRGRMRNAASRGDLRARLTLKAYDRAAKAAPARQPADGRRSVADHMRDIRDRREAAN